MPNDPDVIKEWQIASLRDDIKVKPGDDAKEALAYVLNFYLQMRMRRFAKI